MKTEKLDFFKQTILQYINESNNPKIVFHNYSQMVKMEETILQISSSELLNPFDTQIAICASYFSNIGYFIDAKNEKSTSIKFASNLLKVEKVDKVEIRAILNCLSNEADRRKEYYKLYTDAKNIVRYTKDFEINSGHHKLELELLNDKITDLNTWRVKELTILLEINFFYPYSKKNYESILTNNIFLLKKKIEKNEVLRGKSGSGKFSNLEKNIPTSANQSFLRSNYRNQINLSAIADNKANLMISVNAIIISVLISFLSYKNITESNPMILMPVVIFITTGLTSLIFAVLSARPKITNLNKKTSDINIVKKNILFFGNFVHLDLEDYEDAMDEVLHSSELIYGNMIRDMYNMGQVLNKKYKYLSLSYNVFMLGFITTAISFLTIFLL